MTAETGALVVLIAAILGNFVMRNLEPENHWYFPYSATICVLFFIVISFVR